MGIDPSVAPARTPLEKLFSERGAILIYNAKSSSADTYPASAHYKRSTGGQYNNGYHLDKGREKARWQDKTGYYFIAT